MTRPLCELRKLNTSFNYAKAVPTTKILVVHTGYSANPLNCLRNCDQLEEKHCLKTHPCHYMSVIDVGADIDKSL